MVAVLVVYQVRSSKQTYFHQEGKRVLYELMCCYNSTILHHITTILAYPPSSSAWSRAVAAWRQWKFLETLSLTDAGCLLFPSSDHTLDPRKLFPAQSSGRFRPLPDIPKDRQSLPWGNTKEEKGRYSEWDKWFKLLQGNEAYDEGWADVQMLEAEWITSTWQASLPPPSAPAHRIVMAGSRNFCFCFGNELLIISWTYLHLAWSTKPRWTSRRTAGMCPPSKQKKIFSRKISYRWQSYMHVCTESLYNLVS